jgi:hypothetical protein
MKYHNWGNYITVQFMQGSAGFWGPNELQVQKN